MVGNSRRVAIFFALGLTAAAVGCSSSSSTPVAPITGGRAPTTSPSSTPAPTNSPSPSPTPVPLGTGGVLSSLDACGFFGFGNGTPPPAVAIPGNYSLFITEGNVVGETYSQFGDLSEWVAFNVQGTPAPTPVPTATTATPVPTATPVGAATPISYDVFTGTYTIPTFTVTAEPTGSAEPSAAPTTVAIAQTVGCAIFIVTADRSPIESEPDASPTPISINSVSIGVPNTGGDGIFGDDGQTLTELAEGFLTTFTMNNLTSSGGTAAFTLDAGVNGTVSFGPQQIYSEAKLRALKARMARYHRLFNPRR